MNSQPQIYRHTKTGQLYLYLGEELDSERQVQMVAYQALYGDGQEFTQTKARFFGTIEGGALRFDPDWRTDPAHNPVLGLSSLWVDSSIRKPPPGAYRLVAGASGYKTESKFCCLATWSVGHDRWDDVAGDDLMDSGWHVDWWLDAIFVIPAPRK